MIDQEAKIKDLELRVKKLEDKVFNIWLGQYEPKVNYTQEAQDEWYKGLTAPDNLKKNKWIDDFNPAVLYPDVTTKPFDWNEVPPPIPTQACTNEDIERANKKWSEFISKHPEYK